MTVTVCQAYSCIYHFNQDRCGAEHIAVEVREAGAFCSTYRHQEVYDPASGCDTLGLSVSAAVSSDPAVECQAASCFYNKDTACYAMAIEMLGKQAADAAETRCKTYLPRDGDESYAEERFGFGLYAE
jgi:hypothetical protein